MSLRHTSSLYPTKIRAVAFGALATSSLTRQAMSTSHSAPPENAVAGPSIPTNFLPSLEEILGTKWARAMITLDREAFKWTQPALAVRVNATKVGGLMKNPVLRGYLIDLPKVKDVLPDPDNPSGRLLRLKVRAADELPDDVKETLKSQGQELLEKPLELDYDFWSMSDILNAILPKTGDGDFAPSSFTQTGHIGHVNLRDEWLAYKTLIGQVILDKNTQLRTVVNKLDTIHAEYRYFDMEVLAGEEDFITTVSESSCNFTFDFSKVYWNSRLQHEHDRLVSLLPQGSVVADVMAGVGPFAVPAAKKGCYVLGNDLNPESVKWMHHNRVSNHVEDTLRVYEMDGKSFIRQAVLDVWQMPFAPFTKRPSAKEREKAARRQRQFTKGQETQPLPNGHDALSRAENTMQDPNPPPRLVNHYIMNLPDSALTFLDAFWGVLIPLLHLEGFEAELRKYGLPLIHVYCFTRELDPADAEKDICLRASRHLGDTVSPEIEDYSLYLVRRVAPNKDMYCLSFRLPNNVGLAQGPHPSEMHNGS